MSKTRYSNEKQNHVYLDPPNCGSSVGYRLYVEEHEYEKKKTYQLEATVALTDCNRLIDWSFYGGENSFKDNMEKLDAAIDMLQEFQREYIKAHARVTKLNEVANDTNAGRESKKPEVSTISRQVR